MGRYRHKRAFRTPSMAFSGGPRKPSSQQWHVGRRARARFTCGLCHHQFTRRDNLNRHKRQCYSDVARVNGLLTECRLMTNQQPSQAARPLFPPKRGRPKLAVYACGECGRRLASAQKRIDHTKYCKPNIIVVHPNGDLKNDPRHVELA